jgi:hypothetical protein
MLRWWLGSIGIGVAVACSPGPGDVGSPCDGDEDCVFGECYTGSSPGYCTAECEDEGSTSQCPEGSVCKRIEGGPASCLVICVEDRECPGNSECTGVPSSGGLSGCEPVF